MKRFALWLILLLVGLSVSVPVGHAQRPEATPTSSLAAMPRPTTTPRTCHICDEDLSSNSAATPTARPTATYEPCRVCGEETPTPTPAPMAGPVVHFWFFFDSGCSSCMKVYNGVLPRLLSNYRPEQVTMHTWDVTQGGAGVKRALEQQFGIATGNNTEIFIGEYALLGSQEIETRLPYLIDEYLAQGGVALVLPTVAAQPTATPTAVHSSFLLPTPSEEASAQPAVVRAVLFWSKTCPHCHELINNVLPPLQEKYGNRLDIRMFELSDPANVQLFEGAAEALKVPPERWAVPFMILGDAAMVGSLDIQQQLPALIDKHLAEGGIGLPKIPGLEAVVGPQAPSESPAPFVPTPTTIRQPTPVATTPDYSGCNLTTPCAETTAILPERAVAPATSVPTPRTGVPVVRAVLFWMDGCPHCHEVITVVLPLLQQKYAEKLDVRFIEVKTTEEVERLYRAAADLGISQQNVAVPFLVIGSHVLIGSAQIPVELPGLIEKYLAAGGVDFPRLTGFSDALPTDSATGGAPAVVEPTTAPQERHVLDLPFFGAVDLDAHSLTFSTVLIGFLDGVNPCSLWVISLLLALVVNTGSRQKTLLVGLTFLTVAAALYALIILGLFSVFAFIGYALWIRIAVALIALTFAVVNVKDYFWYKEGLSFTISDEQKPKIYRGIRNILAPNQSTLALIGATAAMAAGVTLIEMPCTAGLPILWTKLITANNVGVLTFAFLLGLYLLMYLVDEMMVFTSVLVTLRVSRLEEKQGRILKLVGGSVMLALALVLLIDPTWMDNIANSVLVFGGAFGAAVLILLVHRKILPQFGVAIGTEALNKTAVRRGK